MPNSSRRLLLALLCSVITGVPSLGFGQRILVQSTTSTQNSGFYDFILPIFQRETGLQVDVVAVGTGQAIRNARNGDADVLLVHARALEDAFVASGLGLARHNLMYNDFVIIGPADDPAGISGIKDLDTALSALAGGRAPFVSRGDDSGTHLKERELWAASGVLPEPSDSWYREAGAGMGATIRVAIELQGYTLSDRATWIAYKRKLGHVILFEGARTLFNQYGIIALNPQKFPYVNAQGARVFIDWLLSARGQALITEFQVDGQQLFYPNAVK